MFLRTYVVTDSIFANPEVEQKLTEVMMEKKEKLHSRFDEIKNFISENNMLADNSLLTYEAVLTKFKALFLEEIVELAVERAFISEDHDICSNLVMLISTERVEEAISGHVMINAFAESIRELSPNFGNWTTVIKGSVIMLIRNRFLNK